MTPPPAAPGSGTYALPQVPARPVFDPDAPAGPDADMDICQITPDAFQCGSAKDFNLAAEAKKPVRAEVYAVRRASTVQALSQAAHRLLYGSVVSTPAAYVPGLPTVDTPADTAHATKIEREAQFAIEVRDVEAAAARVLALVAEERGFVTKDERATSGLWSADLIVRVPAAAFDAFVDALGKVGEVKNRRITATDATLENTDVEILLANLEAALAQYRGILQRATDPGQILAIERELERTRSEIERIKGRLEFLRDRVTYATIAIALHQPPPLQPVVPEGYQPGIATGVRGVSLVDVREGGTNTYLGAGLSLRFPRLTGDSGRGLSLDVDVMRACCTTTPARSDWAYDALFGFDLFSESLDSGKRRWLNPYLGARLGVAQTQDRIDFAAAAALGLEILKTRLLVVGVEARLMALVGNPDGPHIGVQPLLGVDIGL